MTLLRLTSLPTAFSFILLFCFGCKRIPECPDNAYLKDGECYCESGFSGESCEVEDKCITEEPNCNGFECLDGECQCEGFYYGKECSEYLPALLKDTFDVVQINAQNTCSHAVPKWFYISPINSTKNKFKGIFHYNSALANTEYVYFEVKAQAEDVNEDTLEFRVRSPTISGLISLIELELSLIGDTITGKGRMYKLYRIGGGHYETCVFPIKDLVAIRRQK